MGNRIDIEYTGDLKELMKEIRKVMIDKDIKNNDIVEFTGLTKSTISNLLNGRRDGITLDSLLMIINSLGCRLVIGLVDKD